MLSASERKQLRGVVFEVATKVDATRMFADLHKLAWEAAGDGRAAEFLDLSTSAPTPTSIPARDSRISQRSGLRRV
jgi:hypothetical protein